MATASRQIVNELRDSDDTMVVKALFVDNNPVISKMIISLLRPPIVHKENAGNKG